MREYLHNFPRGLSPPKPRDAPHFHFHDVRKCSSSKKQPHRTHNETLVPLLARHLPLSTFCRTICRRKGASPVQGGRTDRNLDYWDYSKDRNELLHGRCEVSDSSRCQ